MIRECPQCRCEILYKKKRSYVSAETNKALCRKCNWAKIAKDPERNRKVSEARKKWWEEKRKNQEEYSAICEKLRSNNSAILPTNRQTIILVIVNQMLVVGLV
jgi:hypothetical protein